MRRALLPAAVALAVVAGCGGGSGSGTADTTAGPAVSENVAPATTPSFEPAHLEPLDPATFSDPLRIDNVWFPMAPGTQLILQGGADRGRGELAHRVEITVTDLSKVVHGVRAWVVWERDFNEGVLRETELAFFAEDDAGNLWNLGEYPEEWDARRFAGACRAPGSPVTPAPSAASTSTASPSWAHRPTCRVTPRPSRSSTRPGGGPGRGEPPNREV